MDMIVNFFKLFGTILFGNLCLQEKGVTMNNYNYETDLAKNIENHTSFLNDILGNTLDTAKLSEARSVFFGDSTTSLTNMESQVAELLESIMERIKKSDYNCNNNLATNIKSSVEKILQFYTEIHPVNLQILYPDLMKIITIING